MNDFSLKLKSYIKKRGWELKVLSTELGISLNTLYSWVSGKRIPPKYVQDLLFYRLDRICLP